jgi:hypothetical protein
MLVVHVVLGTIGLGPGGTEDEETDVRGDPLGELPARDGRARCGNGARAAQQGALASPAALACFPAAHLRRGHPRQLPALRRLESAMADGPSSFRHAQHLAAREEQGTRVRLPPGPALFK